MYISFVGVAPAVVGGHGREWISLVGRRLLLARVFRSLPPVRMLAVGRLVIETIIFDGVAYYNIALGSYLHGHLELPRYVDAIE